MHKQALMEDINWPTVLRYLAGGTLVGGGLGASTSLVNHLKSLHAKQKAMKDTSFDDDTLYVNIPASGVKSAADNNASTYMAAVLASLLGGVGAYTGARNTYLQKRKREAQKSVDASQDLYLDRLLQGQQMRSKTAGWSEKLAGGEGFSAGSKITGGGAAILALLALGSAAASNAALSNYFPGYTKPELKRPRRVVIRRQGMEKEAPAEMSGISQGEIENLMRMKEASGQPGILSGLISAVAQGRYDDVRESVERDGLDATLDMLSGAEKVATNRYHRDLAVSLIATDPLLSQATLPYVAADAADMMPSYCKVASQPELSAFLPELRGMAEAAGELGRRAQWEPVIKRALHRQGVKEAAVRGRLHGHVLESALPQKALMGMLMLNYLGDKDSEEEKNDQASTLAASTAEESNSVDVSSTDAEADAFLQQYPDLERVLRSEVEAAR